MIDKIYISLLDFFFCQLDLMVLRRICFRFPACRTHFWCARIGMGMRCYMVMPASLCRHVHAPVVWWLHGQAYACAVLASNCLVPAFSSAIGVFVCLRPRRGEGACLMMQN